MTRKDDLKKEIRKKVGFKEGLKRSFKIFGDATKTTFKSLGEATNTVLGDGSSATDKKVVNKEVNQTLNKGKQDLFGSIDDIVKGLPE